MALQVDETDARLELVTGRGTEDRSRWPRPAMPSRSSIATATSRCRPTSQRADDADDRERYQTVFARVPGAVAAPTAGLHLTPAIARRARRARRRRSRRSRCTSAPARSSRCAPTTSASTTCTASATTIPDADRARCVATRPAGRRARHDGAARARGRGAAPARSRRRGRDRAVHLSGIRTLVPRRRPADHQLPPARIDAADAGRARSPAPSACSPRTATRSRSATASSATATRCWCTDADSSCRPRGFSFELLATLGNARAGILHTPRGDIETPVFMPVGTAGTVKAMTADELRAPPLDAKIILGNTYHLYLRPGLEVIGAAGGLHEFAAWDRPILTDSGGFQVFSLAGDQRDRRRRRHVPLAHRRQQAPADARGLDADPARARLGHRDGVRPVPARRRAAPTSTRSRSRARPRWAKRCRARAARDRARRVFGIVQGGIDIERRLAPHRPRSRRSTSTATRSAGSRSARASTETYRVLDEVAHLLPAERPRYLMGVGTPADLERGIAAGIDMFDCVMPTRNARNGYLFTDRRPGQHPERRATALDLGPDRSDMPVLDLPHALARVPATSLPGQRDPLRAARNPAQPHVLRAPRAPAARPHPGRGPRA